MKKFIIILLTGLVGFSATSCEDMLTPDMDRYATNFSGKDTVEFYVGILRELQEVTEQHLLLGELRGDLVSPTFAVTDSVSDIMNFQNTENGANQLLNRAGYYKVINQCNFYLAKVDTMAKHNNNYYMRREAAQVMLIRAWTYMQLVQNYHEVPFITEPINTSTTGWEHSAPKATADNLLDLLKSDMDQALMYSKLYGYPNYGNFNTGKDNVSHSLLTFNADVVYGDLYLLRGQSKSDYEQAASHYFTFLYDDTQNVINNIANVSQFKRGEKTEYEVSSQSWNGNAEQIKMTGNTAETVTGVVSAANNTFGMVLSRIPNIYGFDIHSTNSTYGNAEAEDKDATTTTSGQISVVANYKVRQVEPSGSYVNLCQNQSVSYIETDKGTGTQIGVSYATDEADGRMDYSSPIVVTEEGKMRFISKFCGTKNVNNSGEVHNVNGFNFRYLIPLYRYRSVMLRYAEALNRAGFPGHAYAVLRDGLQAEKYPGIKEVIYDINDTDSTYRVAAVVDSVADGLNYISVDELMRAQNFEWASGCIQFPDKAHRGIHEAGCGKATEMDTVSYASVVSKRIIDEATRVGSRAPGRRIAKLLSKRRVDGDEIEEGEEGDEPERDLDLYTPIYDPVFDNPAEAVEAEMLAVETLIADEYAFETAFEGQRYYDLYRLARHMNVFDGANYGFNWMAWKIARRGEALAPYETPSVYDATLYNNVLNNMYLKNPQ